ncbi:MAG: hypothetical protein FWF76_04510 [Oscillospiraceae bacterium]|nr:hypothetical protein [Oscillospiraceae bacterium]
METKIGLQGYEPEDIINDKSSETAEITWDTNADKHERFTRLSETTDEIIRELREIQEKYNIGEKLNKNDTFEVRFAREDNEAREALELKKQNSFKGRLIRNLKNWQTLVSLVAVALSTVAMIFALANTRLTIGQGQLYVEDGSVNQMLGNLIGRDLNRLLTDDVNLQEINVRVEIHGSEDSNSLTSVSNIDADTDNVTAEIVFFPQNSIAEFAEDVYVVLQVMNEQAAYQGFVYDNITFVARDTLTHIQAVVSGRLSEEITVEEIITITRFFGEIEVSEDEIPDIVAN